MRPVQPLKTEDSTKGVGLSQRPLPLSYFTEYADADNEDGGASDRSYATNWRDYGFSRFTDYQRLLRERSYSTGPDSVYETGSADGSVIKELLKQGIDARGCELSKAILRTCKDKEIRSRISHGNAYEIVKSIPDNSFDCVYETSAQYLKRKQLPRYFRQLHRITKRDLVIVLHTVEEDPKPHRFQVNHLPNQEWIDLITETGFVLGYINHPEENHAPFWFRKISQ